MGERPKSVLIVGGSLAGLMTGVVLKQLGHHVCILERYSATHMKGKGAGIMAQVDVQQLLTYCGLLEPPYSVHSPNLQMLKFDGSVKRTWNIAWEMTSWNTLYFRLRAAFDGLLSEYCSQGPEVQHTGGGQGVYEHGKIVTDVKSTDHRVTVYFDDVNGAHGSSTADLVIAADGTHNLLEHDYMHGGSEDRSGALSERSIANPDLKMTHALSPRSWMLTESMTGANSSIRTILEPKVQKQYSGYVAWRGTVVESEISQESRKVFRQMTTSFAANRSYILMHSIPGDKGSLEPGERQLNYAWYCNYAENSAEFADLMTDVNGHRHRDALPIGGVRDEIWLKQKALARDILAPPFAELVNKTTQPFVATISETMSPRASFLDGRVLLVGDALASFRPHAALSTNQAAFDALLLGKVMKGEMPLKAWEQAVLEYGNVSAARSRAMGTYIQSGWGTFLVALVKYALVY